MRWPKVDLQIRLHSKNSKIHPQQQITPKIQKERLYGLTHHLVLMFQQISAKNSSAYWVNISQKRISFINCSTVIMSRLVISLPNFKSMNNDHNKNILNEQEKPPCNFRNKTSCPLEGIYQHKNLVLYFLVKFQSQIPDLKKNPSALHWTYRTEALQT